MAVIRSVILLTLLSLIFLVRPASAERRVALVIGNSAYQFTQALRNPRNDAEDVSTALKKLGFEVTTAFDLTAEKLAETVSQYLETVRGADVSLFYYAGHAMQLNDNKNYLVAVDAQIKNEFRVKAETMVLDDIIRPMEALAKTTLVFLDACRDNPMADRLRKKLRSLNRSTSVGRGLTRFAPAGNNTLITYAAAPGRVALDGDKRNSPFTTALLKHMTTPGLEIEVMLKRVTREVITQTKNKQAPERLSRLTTEFYFVPAKPVLTVPQSLVGTPPPTVTKTTPPQIASLAPRQNTVRQAYQDTTGIGTCGAYKAFAESFKGTFHAKLAQEWLEKNCRKPTKTTLTPTPSKDAAKIYKRAVEFEHGRNGRRKSLFEAARLFRQAADLGHTFAMTDLGYAYAHARGVDRDFGESLRWYRQAAAKGNARSMNNLGFAYENGRGVTKDAGEAMRWYRKAADAGDTLAMNNVAKSYTFGRGVRKDPVEGVRWFHKAAAKNYAPAFFSLGYAYSTGRGATRDNAASIRWYLKAAAKGNAIAMTNLAIKYDEGKGATKDFRKAANYLLRAVKAGDNRLSRDKGKGWALATKRAVQRKLRNAGVYEGVIDGQIGSGTLAALKAYGRGETTARQRSSVSSGGAPRAKRRHTTPARRRKPARRRAPAARVTGGSS